MAESIRLNIVVKGQKELKDVEALFRQLIKTMGGVQAATQKVQRVESEAVKAKKQGKAELQKEIALQRKLQIEIKSALSSKKTERELAVQMRRVTLQSNGAYRAQAAILARLEAKNKDLRNAHRQLWQETKKGTTETRKFNTKIKQTTQSVKKFNKEAVTMSGLLKTGLKIGAGFGAWKLITGIIRLYVRQLQMALRFMTKMVKETFSFLNTLERTRFAMAAIMGNASKTTEHFASLGEATKVYKANLGRAAAFQREVLLLSTRVAGTAEELLDASQRVLAFGSQQIATDRERIILTANLVQMSKMLGLHGEKMLTEIRQIFELNRRQGQTILETMGIDIKRVRIYKNQGMLIREMNRQALAFQAASFDMANTWTQLLDAMKVFRNLIFGDDLTLPFQALKQIIIGVRDELGAFFQLQRQFGMSDEEKAAAKAAGKWEAVALPAGWHDSNKTAQETFGFAGLMSAFTIPEEDMKKLSAAIAQLIIQFGDLVGVIAGELVEGLVGLTPLIIKFTAMIMTMTANMGGLNHLVVAIGHTYAAFVAFGKLIVAAAKTAWHGVIKIMAQVEKGALELSLKLDSLQKTKEFWTNLVAWFPAIRSQFRQGFNPAESLGMTEKEVKETLARIDILEGKLTETGKNVKNAFAAEAL